MRIRNRNRNRNSCDKPRNGALDVVQGDVKAGEGVISIAVATIIAIAIVVVIVTAVTSDGMALLML